MNAAEWVPFTPVWNVTGQPAISLPLHQIARRACRSACSSSGRPPARSCCCRCPRSSRRRAPGPSGARSWRSHERQLLRGSAADMARAVRDREISPVELVQAHIDRAEERKDLNIVVLPRYEQALEEARAAEQELADGDRRRAAARRAVHGQGVHRGRRDAVLRRVARSSRATSRPRTRPSCATCAARARSCSARPTSPSSRSTTTRTTWSTAPRATRTTPSAPWAAPRAARAPRSRRASRRSASAPTTAGRSACPRTSTASSG